MPDRYGLTREDYMREEDARRVMEFKQRLARVRIPWWRRLIIWLTGGDL